LTTENIRLVLVILLSFIGLLLWEAWQKDYGHAPQAPVLATSQAPAEQAPTTPPIPAAKQTPDIAAVPKAPASAISTAPASLTVETDLFSAEINLAGGVIEKLSLKKYRTSGDQDAAAFRLLDNGVEREFIAQSGLKSEDRSADHYARFEASANAFQMADGQDTLEVPLRWQAGDGLEVTRTLVFRRGSYEITQKFDVKNGSSKAWTFNHYQQLQRQSAPVGHQLVPTFTGLAVSTPEKRYEKHEFEDLTEQPIAKDVTGGWLALIEHYFLGAIIPDSTIAQHFYSFSLGHNRYIVGFYGPSTKVDPGGAASTASRFYLGPKLQETLPKIAPGLELTVDYGVLWFIAELLFSVLTFLHGMLGNWGWAIIVLTLLIKLVFYPLSAAGYRSMAKMRAVQPRLLQLRERYPDDKARLNQAMMEMYKQEKINPLGGCFPILIQIPVFISLYWMILESVEIRQAPFMLWIHDLSVKDPYYVLPALMLVSMWIQTKMNPTPPDPIQAKVMQIMPLIFGVFFAFFPAGLVLYWFVNNVLSISQQWWITRQIEGATQTAR
jgi:YidC/Oxa1 family membrane protein insertase